MQTFEGYVVLFYMLLLLLTLMRSGCLNAVPRYQGQGARAYAALLWKLWKTVEPAQIRDFRAAVVWIADCTVLIAHGVIPILLAVYNAVYIACDAVAATLDAVLWLVYVHAVAAWLMITIPIVWAVKTALSNAVAAIVTACWAVYVILVVKWLLLKAAVATLVHALWSSSVNMLQFAIALLTVTRFVVVSTARCLCSSSVFLLQFATAVLMVTRFVAVSTALYVWSFFATMLQFTTAVVVVTRFVAVSMVFFLMKTAMDLLTTLHSYTMLAMVGLITRFMETGVWAVNFGVAFTITWISQALVLLKTSRILCCHRMYHLSSKNTAWMFVCILLIPTRRGEWTVVRLGVEVICEKKAMMNNKNADRGQQRATDELLAPHTEPRSKSAAMWGIETRTVWICEVLPVARPVSTVSLARYSAPPSLASSRDEEPLKTQLLVAVCAYVTVLLSVLIATIVKAIPGALLQDEMDANRVLAPLDPLALAFEAKKGGEETEERLSEDGVNKRDGNIFDGEAVQLQEDHAGIVVEADKQPEPQLEALQLEVEPPAPAEAVRRLRTPAVLLPRLRNVRLIPMAPLRFKPADPKLVQVPEEEPVQHAVKPDEMDAAPSQNHAAEGEVQEPEAQNGHGADPTTERGAEQEGAGQEEQSRARAAREPLVIDHGYDYNRDAAARYLDYVETSAYQARRKEARDRISNRT